jgi:hypothetical protein
MPKLKETPFIYADRLAKLSPEERAELRAMLTSKVWVKLCRIVTCMKPSAHCKNGGSGDRDEFSDQRTNARLGEIRGWEMYEAMIFLAIQEPKLVQAAVQETFPDSGKIDSDWGQIPQK